MITNAQFVLSLVGLLVLGAAVGFVIGVGINEKQHNRRRAGR